MIGGSSVKLIRRFVTSRSGLIITSTVVGSLALIGVGLAERLEIPVGFWVAIGLLALFSLLTAIAYPVQQAFMNGCIPSEQRATVLSFASLMGSAGGVVAQPALGRVADVFSYGIAYVVAGVVYVVSLPFLIAVRRMGLPADRVTGDETTIAA
jgi:sugar phosphate permease